MGFNEMIGARFARLPSSPMVGHLTPIVFAPELHAGLPQIIADHYERVEVQRNDRPISLGRVEVQRANAVTIGIVGGRA